MAHYLPGVPDEQAEEIVAAMQSPEGTAAFWGTYAQLLDESAGAGVLLEVVAGEIVFVLVRDADLVLRFIHATPGKGTHEAAVNLRLLQRPEPCEQFFFALVWSPDETRLHVGRRDGGDLLESVSELADYSLQVAQDGTVFRIGDAGVAVMGARGYAGGAAVMGPPAIKVWEDTTVAAGTLLGGESGAGHLYDVVTGNAVLTLLVTGFETYVEQRFVELEGEGLAPDWGALVREFLSREENERVEQGQQTQLEDEAVKHAVSPVRLLAKRINFQNYDNAKKAFNRGYGLKFGELPSVSAQHLEQLQRLIRYRHRVVHVSPLLGLLNGPECPPEEPFFSSKAMARDAIQTFESFIVALHRATVDLRP